MKTLLTLVAACAILMFGCAEPQLPGEPVRPWPDFKNPKSEMSPRNAPIDFSCTETPDKHAGKVVDFGGHVHPNHEKNRLFSMWVFNTRDVILVEHVTTNDKNYWYDYGADQKPEYYFADPHDIPGFPDICAGLEALRKK